MLPSRLPLIAGLFWLCAIPAQATIIAFDAFIASADGSSGAVYNDLEDIATRGPTSATGFTGVWSASTFFDAGVAADNLSFSTAPTSSPGAGQFNTSVKVTAPTAANQPRLASRALTPIAAGAGATTLWVSSMISASGDSNSTNTATFTLATGVAPGVSQLMTTAFSTSANHLVTYGIVNSEAALQYRNFTDGALTTVPLLDSAGSPVNVLNGASWFFVLQIERAFSGTDDRVTAWLNPTDISSTAAMTASAAASVSVTNNIWLDTETVSRVGMDLADWDELRILKYDNIVLGTTLADVVIPEPSSLLLIAGGFPLLLFRRRTRV